MVHTEICALEKCVLRCCWISVSGEVHHLKFTDGVLELSHVLSEILHAFSVHSCSGFYGSLGVTYFLFQLLWKS